MTEEYPDSRSTPLDGERTSKVSTAALPGFLRDHFGVPQEASDCLVKGARARSLEEIFSPFWTDARVLSRGSVVVLASRLKVEVWERETNSWLVRGRIFEKAPMSLDDVSGTD